MKNFTLLLSLLVVLSACYPDQGCLPPKCHPLDVNKTLSLQLQFCSEGENLDCYSFDELQQVLVAKKSKKTNRVIGVDSFYNLANFNNTITLGKGFIPLVVSTIDNTIESYDYEISIPSIGKQFSITELNILDLNRNDYCECPSYQISSLKLDGKLIDIKSNEGVITIPR